MTDGYVVNWPMVIVVVGPLTEVVGPLPNGHSWLWLIHGGDPNYFVSGMILQVPFLKLTKPPRK